MKYQITITVDDETVYTHNWENYTDNIVFGHTPQLAELEPEAFFVAGTVMETVGETFANYRFYNREDLPTEPTTEAGDLPDYVEDKLVQATLSKLFASLRNELMFDGVEASA